MTLKRTYVELVEAIVAYGLVFAGALAYGQQYSADRPIGLAAQQLPDYLKHAGILQHLNETLPMNTSFIDEGGNKAPLSHWIGERPAILVLLYYKCTMMCPQVLHGLAVGLKASNLIPGRDYDVVTFSIDPGDSPADAAGEKAQFIKEVGLPSLDSAAHFLTSDPSGIRAISEATGFQYVRVPGPNGIKDQFAHSSVILFVTPDGRLSQYISGIEYPARDLRLAVLNASQKRISNPADLLLIYCCNYNPSVGRYSVAVLRILSTAGGITVVLFIGLIWVLTRQPIRKAAA